MLLLLLKLYAVQGLFVKFSSKFIFQISPEPNSSQTFDHYPYLAYSPNGTVEADLVYANYGDDADFEKLAEMNVTVKGNIVIIRSRSVSMNELQAVLVSGSRAFQGDLV